MLDNPFVGMNLRTLNVWMKSERVGGGEWACTFVGRVDVLMGKG